MHQKRPLICLMIGNASDHDLMRDFFEVAGYDLQSCLAPDLLMNEREISLIIADEANARLLSNKLLEMKQRQRPLFLPALVLVAEHAKTASWLQLGFDDVLHMPIHKEELLIRLKTFLQLRKNSRGSNLGSEDFITSTLDALSDQICVVDYQGNILLVNEAWRVLAQENGADKNKVWENFNYFSVCELATKLSRQDVKVLLEGFREVVQGIYKEFSHEYSCQTKTKKLWFVVKIARFTWKHKGVLVISHTNITAIRFAETELYRVAHYDTVTNLPNRNFFHHNFKRALFDAKRNKQMLGLLYIDLDHFKMINDKMGHAVGDQVLREASRRLTKCVRSGDMVGRLGGDEFCAFLPGLKREQDAGLVAQKVVDSFSKPIDINGVELFVTGSVGVTVCPTDGEEIDALLNAADTAMYAAKEKGRGNYQFFKASMNDAVLERANIANGLHRALEREELFLVYQPQFDLKTGRMRGCEALMRWLHPERGLISPDAFISIAEETGKIIHMGEWAIQTACAQNKAWQEEGLAPIVVAVNLSVRQVKDDDLFEVVRGALESTGLDGKYLELEVTESIVMQDVEQVIRTMQDLKSLGVKLSIDDFGTGYSNLAYLKRFPLDTIKIDKSFVSDIRSANDASGGEIANMIISLGHNLNLEIVAEGVETEEQKLFLREAGCDLVQGYYISHPLPKDEFKKFLKNSFMSPG